MLSNDLLSKRKPKRDVRVKFEELYDSKSIMDIKNERINRMRELDEHVRMKSRETTPKSSSVSPHKMFHSKDTSKGGIPMPLSLSSGTQ